MATIVAITVCINYSDYLGSTLPSNAKAIDVMYLGTSSKDEHTIALCKDHPNVRVFEFDEDTVVKARGAKLNKSGMVRAMQEDAHRTYPNAWILILDADIILPPDFKSLVTTFALSTEGLYGITRYDYYSQEDLTAEKKKMYPLKHAGFFQLYFSKDKYYEPFSMDCTQCDITFVRLFKQRPVLPGSVSHLGQPCVNWYGRKSPAWN